MARPEVSGILRIMGDTRTTLPSLPAARIVSRGRISLPTWRALALRRRMNAALTPLRPALETAAVYVIGLFPLVAALGLATALIWIAGFHSSP